MGCDVFDALVAVGTMISAGCSGYLVASKFAEGKPHVRQSGNFFRVVNEGKKPIVVCSVIADKGCLLFSRTGPVDAYTGRKPARCNERERDELNRTLYHSGILHVSNEILKDGVEYEANARLKRHWLRPSHFDLILSPGRPLRTD